MLLRARPRRRLRPGAALLALTVLLTSLGRGHPPCPRATDAGDGAHVHAGPERTDTPSGAAHAAHVGHDDGGSVPAACFEHVRHTESGNGCATVTHCGVAVAPTAAVVPVAAVRLLSAAVLLTASQPLDASYQPDSPPPKA